MNAQIEFNAGDIRIENEIIWIGRAHGESLRVS